MGSRLATTTKSAGSYDGSSKGSAWMFGSTDPIWVKECSVMGGTWSEPRLNLSFSHGPEPLAIHVPLSCTAALAAIRFGSTNCAQCMECFWVESKKISGRQ